MRPDRIVIGTERGAADSGARLMGAALRALQPPARPMLQMDVRSAELTKYAANAMLATRISFMNELANLGRRARRRHRAGAQGDRRRPAHRLQLPLRRRRLRRQLLSEGRAGADAHGRDHGQRLAILEAVRAGQRRAEARAGRQARRAASATDLHGRTFALWGLAFKPNTDDMREAPSRVMIKALLDRGARVVAYDPVAMAEARRASWPTTSDDERLGAPDPLRRIADAGASRAPTPWSS